MIKSKERILEHQYNRREFHPTALEIVTKDITLGEAAKLSVAFPDTLVGFDPVMGYYKQSGATIIGMDYAKQPSIATIAMNSTDVTIYSAIRSRQLYDAEFKDVPIWTFYEYLRTYHVFEIIIAFLITLGVILWLK